MYLIYGNISLPLPEESWKGSLLFSVPFNRLALDIMYHSSE